MICCILAAVRLLAALWDGALVITSGGEEESLFAIWKRVHGMDVYADPFAPPFAQSYFNYLYYLVYGAGSKLGLLLFGGRELTIPTIARLVTVLFACAEATALYLIGRLLRFSPSVAIMSAVTICAGPLQGWWDFTTRPDIAALACEFGALYFIMKARKREHASAVFWLSIPLFYSAWAFKQSQVAGAAAVVLYLICRKEWARTAGFALLLSALLAMTILMGNDTYRYALMKSQLHMGWSAVQSIKLLSLAFLKSPLFAVGTLAACYQLIVGRKANVLLLSALTTSMLFGAVASSKAGASENYYFEAAAIASLLFFEVVFVYGTLITAGSLTFAAEAVSALLILTGVAGVVWPHAQSELLALQPAEKNLGGGSAVVSVPAGNLPWFQDQGPYFVLATTYPTDRSNGRAFQHHGIGEMIKSGEVKVFVCPVSNCPSTFDGLDVKSLRVLRADSQWAYLTAQ